MRVLNILAILTLALAWLLTTNSGLNVALKVAGELSPLKIEYSKAEGKFIGQPIRIHNLKITQHGNTLTAEYLEVDWQFYRVNALKIQGLEEFLPNKDILVIGKFTQLNRLTASLEKLGKQKIYRVSTFGTWQEQPLAATAKISQIDKSWLVETARIKVGNNTASALAKDDFSYTWNIDFKQPETIFKDIKTKVIAHGSITDLNQTQPKINARISADNLKLNVSGNFKQHIINGLVKYDNYIINLNAHGSLVKDIWQTKDLVISSQNESLRGSASYDLKRDLAKIELNGKLFAIDTALALGIRENKLDGSVNLSTDDISPLMKLIPEMTRLKGKFRAQAKIAGTLEQPIVKTDAHLTEITATFPGMGIKIKPMELHVVSDSQGRFNLNGSGKMRRGSGEFFIKGYVEPFRAGMPNRINLIGKNIEFINNHLAHLIASNDLDFYYDKQAHRLDINGYIEIEEGDIYFSANNTSTVKSKDIVFIGEKTSSKELLINPNLNLRILEATRFSGFNLNAEISGKLDIAQRNGAIYSTGRVTIKQGTYSLPGQTLQINKGRLLYPPGTLLSNPSLDIKLHGIGEGGLDLMVQGNAEKPIISETDIADNPDKALSQVLTTGTGVLSDKVGRGKVRMPELGLASRDEHSSNFFDDPSKQKSSLRNKDLVVGMPLGKKIHLQYLQSISDADKNGDQANNKRLRLKYNFNKNWNIGIETGDQGPGVDLGFVFER